ncbi:glycyl-radical enzyme activating protein [Chloroflexota bacterium]
MKGCPLSCRWCSNPESMKSVIEIMDFSMKCTGCGRCQEACPRDAVYVADAVRKVDKSKCDLCMRCVEVCFSGGKEVIGRYISVDECVKEVEKDKLFYANSGGGMTVSGGEPLLQWEFVRDVLEACKAKGIHTALDTTGYAPWGVLESVLPFVDLVLYDIKNLSDEAHKLGTGVNNELILANVRKVAETTRVWLRVPLIPDFNDADSDIEGLAQLGLELGVDKISLLPYHSWGEQKYERLGREYLLHGVDTQSEERVGELKRILDSHGLGASIGL